MSFNKFIPIKYQVILFQFSAYASIIPMIIYASWWQWLLSILLYFLISGLGMAMGYHRLLSHRCFICQKYVEYLLVFLATFSLTGSAISWVSIHRKHHLYSDTSRDPHCPDIMGFWRVQFFTALSHVEGKYATDLMRIPFYKFQHKYYISIILGFYLLVFILQPIALVYCLMFPAALSLAFSTLVLSWAHRNFKPRSVMWLSFITFGESFHDIHHDAPSKRRLHKYDIVGWLIEKIFN